MLCPYKTTSEGCFPAANNHSKQAEMSFLSKYQSLDNIMNLPLRTKNEIYFCIVEASKDDAYLEREFSEIVSE